MSKTYLFYDLETSGLNKAFDQVLQFAAIRTDLNLQEIERHEFYLQLNPDVIPSPGAVATHLLRLEDLKKGKKELDALREIHRLLNYPGTISVGYNTLQFDDEFLRFSFYRNLLSPYTHQYANQCSRMDIYPMTIFYYLFKPTVAKWPIEQGAPTLKLEKLNALNHLALGPAHHAMADVEATLALAKLFFAEKEMWDYLCGYFDKRIDQTRFLALPFSIDQHREALYVEGVLGARYQFQAPVIELGTHHHYKNQTLFLRLDLPELREVTLDNIKEKTWCVRKKMGEPGFLLPKTERFLAHLNASRQEEMEKNKHFLREHPDLFSAICRYHLEYQYPILPAVDVDAALYLSDFWSAQDQAQCEAFHLAKLTDKHRIIEQLQRPDLAEMALRAVGRHDIHLLSNAQKIIFENYLRALPTAETTDYRGEKRLIAAKALEEIDTLLIENKLNAAQRHALMELKTYLLG